jgi:endonuclease/exonuclease/phosphatase family metal-dependent hydrolase
MKIITLNTWGTNGPHEKRFPLIESGIREENPDLVCLQEVFGAPLKDRLKKACGFGYSHESHPAGLVILSRFPIHEIKIYPYRTISPNEMNDRRIIFAQIELKGNLIWIGNTHLSWKPEDEAVRLSQMKELLEQVKALGTPQVILTGDFNCPPESNPILAAKMSGFLEIFGELNPEEDGFTWDNKRNPYLKTHSVELPDRRIDLVLMRKELLTIATPKTCELVFTEPDAEGNFPSDHFGLSAELI